MSFRKLQQSLRSPIFILCGMLFAAGSHATETVVYSEGFESNNGGYNHTGTNDTWEWGSPSPLFTDGPMAAHSGSSCWGTDLDDTVPFNSNAYLTSPAITLPALGADSVMRIRFFGWIAVDLMFDRGEFQVSSDGITWETKAELLCSMLGGWTEYTFDISDLAGGSLYLRFRCLTDDANTFDPPLAPENMAGFYIDDIAITITDVPAIKKTLTFEGSESQSDIASCPWICIPTKKSKKGDDPEISSPSATIPAAVPSAIATSSGSGSGFIRDNDIYSTARGKSKEYTDYYMPNNLIPVEDDGTCNMILKETGDEQSYTDLLHLVAVEHDASVDIVSDEKGNTFTYKKNKTEPPVAAVDKGGHDVLSMVTAPEEFGYKAYNGNFVDLTFSWNGSVPHPILLLRALGFMKDSTAGTPTGVTPGIEIQTQDPAGTWITRYLFYPRWKYALCGFDLAGLLPYAKKVRLLSSSCHVGKYHLIDWAAISKEPQKSLTITEYAPVSAIRSDGSDMTAALASADGTYAHLVANEEISLTYKVSVPSSQNKVHFIVKSKGYYIPTGTFFFYTWNGSAWAQRDAWTIQFDGDQTRQFDFSQWLPDPTGQNRVRIWQDYIFDPASIDFVGLTRDSVSCIMSYATDLRNNTSILNLCNVSDNQRFEWDWGENWPERIRWVEVGWADSFVNTPPSTSPVYVTNTNLSTPTINWTYFDLDNNPQTEYEVEVWTGPGGTGNIVWDPQPGQGAATSVIYAGPPLSANVEYFARVKALDSLNWGGWSEAAFTLSTNNPPVADAGNDTTVIALPTCLTSVVLDGSASSDPDGDTLSFLWTGPFGTATGSVVAVSLYPGTAHITLIVSDGKGGSASDSVTIIVHDTIAPVPDSTHLEQISGECSVVITDPPTATDNCAGTIVGTTQFLTFSIPGTYTVIWNFCDADGNCSTQPQTVVVTDNSAPVPDAPSLPLLSGECSVTVTQFPTASDNCAGTIVGTTTDSLSFSDVGNYTITWRYNDGNGNTALQTQSVQVTDNAAPVPDICPLPDIQSNCVLTVSTIPTATDFCRGTVPATTSDPLTYTQAGTYTIHWVYDDDNGNTTWQTQTATVIDNDAPVPMTNPLPVINGFIFGNRCYTVRIYPSAMDNCKGQIIGITTDPLVYCYRGTFTITWHYSDGNGNESTQQQTVIIR